MSTPTCPKSSSADLQELVPGAIPERPPNSSRSRQNSLMPIIGPPTISLLLALLRRNDACNPSLSTATTAVSMKPGAIGTTSKVASRPPTSSQLKSDLLNFVSEPRLFRSRAAARIRLTRFSPSRPLLSPLAIPGSNRKRSPPSLNIWMFRATTRRLPPLHSSRLPQVVGGILVTPHPVQRKDSSNTPTSLAQIISQSRA